MGTRVRTKRWLIGSAVALGAVALVGGGVIGLYKFQKQRLVREHRAIAETAAAEGDWTRAAIHWRAYLSDEPRDAVALRAYADALLELVNSTETEDIGTWLARAKGALQELHRRAPTDTQALAELVDLYSRSRQLDEALHALESWIAAAPNVLEPILIKVDVTRLQGKHKEAIALLEAAIDSHPASDELYARLIHMHLKDPNDLPKAGEWVEQALEACPDSWSVKLAAYAQAIAAGETEAAERYLGEAVSLGPNEYRVLLDAALHALRERDLASARQFLDRAAEVGGSDDGLLLETEFAWARAQPSDEERVRVADRLQEASRGKSAELLIRAADLYLQATALEKVDGCLAQLDNLAIAETKYAAVKGARLLAAHQPIEALQLLEQAVASEPQNGRVAYLLGLACERAGMPAAAREAFQRAAGLQGQPIGPRLGLARSALLAGRYGEAATHVVAAIKIDPAHVEVIWMGLVLELQAAISAKGTDSEAVGAVQARIASAIETHPEDVRLIRLAASAFRSTGNQDKAVALLERKMASPSLAEPMAATLSEILAADGQPDASEQTLRMALEQHPRSRILLERFLAALVSQDRIGEMDERLLKLEDPDLRGHLYRAMGDHAVRAGKVELATRFFEQAASLRSEDITSRRKLLRINPVQADAVKVDRLIEEIRAAEGESGLVWRFERARALLNRQESDGIAQAVELLEECRDRRPAWVPPRLILGYALERQGQDVSAPLAEYDEVARLAPQLLDTGFGQRYAILLKRAERYEEAQAVVARLARTEPTSTFVLRQLLEDKYRNRDWTGAAQVADQLMAKDPNDPDWMALTADLQRLAGRVKEAEQTARQAIALAPDALAPLRSLAATLVATGRSEEATRAVTTFLATHSDHRDGYVLLGTILSAAGRKADADQAYETVATLSAEQPDMLRKVSGYFARRGDRRRQLEYLRRAIEVEGGNPDESPAIARILLAAPEADSQARGREIVAQRLSRQPNDAEALLLSAKLLASGSGKDRDRAESQLRKLLEYPCSDPIRVEAYHLRASLYAVNGEREQALRAIDEGLRQYPRSRALRAQRGRIANADGRWTEALTDLLGLVDDAPSDTLATGLLARAYEGKASTIEDQERSQHFLTQADELLTKRYELDPTSTAYFIDLARFLQRQGRYADIKGMTEQHQDARPQDHTASLIAATLVLTGDADPELHAWAVGVLDDLTEKGEHVQNALTSKAIHYQRQGKVEEAESMLEQALELDPDDGNVINSLAWVYCEDRNRPDRALALLGPYIRMNEDDLGALDTYGVILYRQGKTEESLDIFQRCRMRATAGSLFAVAADFHVGRSLLALGQREEGRRHLRAALDTKAATQILSARELREADELLR